MMNPSKKKSHNNNNNNNNSRSRSFNLIGMGPTGTFRSSFACDGN